MLKSDKPATSQKAAAKVIAWSIPAQLTIIAELGINHNGDLDIARRLIDAAHAAGCDAVKFQKRTIDLVYSPDILSQPRQSPWGATQRAQKEGLELSEADYDAIDAHCKALDIEWFASAWDLESQAFLAKYNSRYNKIASAMTTYAPLVKAVAAEGKHTFLSTGMCTLEQVEAAVEIMTDAGCPFTLMHTVSTYPTPPADLNLLTLQTLRQTFAAPVGYSGHETGIEASLVAAVLGAHAIERHLTLDRSMYGSDQAASIEPDEMKRLVQAVRQLGLWLGDGEKRLAPGESGVAEKLRYWTTT
jgi:N-acetylneuraminate synthase